MATEEKQHDVQHTSPGGNFQEEWHANIPKKTENGVARGQGGDVSLGSQKELLENDQEREHLENVCDSFRQYATFMRSFREGQAARVAAIPLKKRELLPRWMIPGIPESKERDTVMQEAELRNQFFFDSMLKHAGLPNSQDIISKETNSSLVHSQSRSKNDRGENINWVTDESMDKVHSVLKSLSRDWSQEGSFERTMCYQPILKGISKYIPIPEKAVTGNGSMPMAPRIIVPGAGVGRLALEIYSMGYEVQGNEFSLHMLLASDFILNGCCARKPFAISPWLASTRNVCRAADPARKILVPDVDPAAVMLGDTEASSSELPDFSMAAGEFVSIYSKPKERGRWQGVASCFFLDTAPNLVEYLQVMYDMLDENGVLINFGPLLFHWSGPPMRPDDISFDKYLSKHSHMDKRYLESVDMSWEDVREILWRVGFEIVEEALGIKARYTADPRSFMNSDYRCIYFVAKKSKSRRQPPQIDRP